jgi:altronate dehydratase large subunit
MRALQGMAAHPNVGAVLVVGGDEDRVEAVADAARRAGRGVASLTLDHCEHDALRLAELGVRAGARLMHEASRGRRVRAGLADLFLGLECGRSDPSSGLVANPLLGRMADRVVGAGGRAVIGETTEWLGAEGLLAARARSPGRAREIEAAAGRREALATAAGIDLTGHNPSATNIAAGLSSIEEKSLGAIAKSGSGPIDGLIGYAQAPTGPGLYVMDAPAYAPESVTGFVAAGANLVLFTTGVGNFYGSALAPTIKVTANPETARRLSTLIDSDVSAVFEGRMPIETAEGDLLALLLDVAGGSLTWAETVGEQDEVISRFGPAL